MNLEADRKNALFHPDIFRHEENNQTIFDIVVVVLRNCSQWAGDVEHLDEQG
jgi:hypothetical protein